MHTCFCDKKSKETCVTILFIKEKRYLLFVSVVFFILVSSGVLAQNVGIKKIDSLELVLKRSDAKQRFEILFRLFKEYLPLNYDSASLYAEKSINEARRIKDSLAVVKSHNARGWVRMKMGNYGQCIPDFEYALAIAKRQGYNDQVKYLLNNLAISYNDIAAYDKALDYHFQSLHIREIEQNPTELGVALNNIGAVYASINDNENAIKYYARAIEIKEKSGDSYELDRAYINLSLSNLALGRYDIALENLNKVFDLCSQGCKDEILIELYLARAQVYIQENKYNLTDTELVLAFELAEKISSKKYEAKIYHSRALIKWQEGKINEALQFLKKSEALSEETNSSAQMLSNYLFFIKIYEKQRNYELASTYQQKYIELNNEIFSGDLIKNISRIQTEHEERENIKTIAAKNQVVALQAEVIARQQEQYAFIITITFLVLGLAFVMYRANQSQRKTNQALAVAKQTIQEQNEKLSDTNRLLENEVEERTRELVETNESLIKVNDEMDNFIYKTSHDIRGPLASLKGICNVAMMDVKDEAALDYLNKLDTSAAKLNSILSRLLIINQINHSILTPEYINLEGQIDEILELERKKELSDRIEITYEVEQDLDFRSDKEMAKIILENLIDNAIKFHNDSGRVNPFVRIEITSESKWVVVKVIDNGIGVDADSKDKIFRLFVRASDRSDTGGIGLYLSKLATLKLGGTIDLSTSEEGHTVFCVRFPHDLVPIIEMRKAEELKREKQKQKVLKVT